jgi:dTDP-4-amino-4,6-dideoxygalactose transaminase
MTQKSRVTDLALLGGSSLFGELLHVGRPNIGDREHFHARVDDMFDRRWLSNNGPFVQELESKLADYLGVRHCISICNATVGLEIAARALGMKGEVILPSFTFVATAHSLQWQEITPVFCDVDPETHNLDPRRIEDLITPRTTGILGVHVWGRACPVEQIEEIARIHNLKVMYDAAHAFGCDHRGHMIGGFGDAEVFSFHATKFFNSFEGGAVTTNSDELAARIRSMRNFGFSGLDNVVDIGTNGKMSEVSAAMGLTSFESLNDFIEANRTNYLCYASGLRNIPGIRLIEYDGNERNNYQYVVIEIDPAVFGMDRDALVRILHAENVRARRYFYPGCHQMEPYRSLFPHAGLLLPETERLTLRVLQLPTGTSINGQEIGQICELLHFIHSNAGRIIPLIQGL